MTDPSTCHACRRRAIGVGMSAKPEPHWICIDCAQHEGIFKVRNFDAYELAALDGAVDAVGEFIESIAGKTELADYTELEQRMLCKAAIAGFGERLRKLVGDNNAPF